MKSTLSDLDPLFQELSKVTSKNNEKRQKLNEQLGLLFSQLDKNESYKSAHLVHAALSAINAASSLILGLEEEISFRKVGVENGDQEIFQLNSNLKSSVTELEDKYREQQHLTKKVFTVAAKSIKVKNSEIKKVKTKIIKSTSGIVKGGKTSKWKYAENHILKVLKKLLSSENQLKQKNEKMTQISAIIEIEKLLNDGSAISESTFSGWLKKYRKNKGERIFD